MSEWLPLIQTIQSILMVGAAVIVWILGRERKTIDSRIDYLDRRMDHASARASELAGDVQDCIGRIDRMPESLRDKFVSSDLMETLIEESRRDRQALWTELRRIRSTGGRR